MLYASRLEWRQWTICPSAAGSRSGYLPASSATARSSSSAASNLALLGKPAVAPNPGSETASSEFDLVAAIYDRARERVREKPAAYQFEYIQVACLYARR